jgi:hypothetical protein
MSCDDDRADQRHAQEPPISHRIPAAGAPPLTLRAKIHGILRVAPSETVATDAILHILDEYLQQPDTVRRATRAQIKAINPLLTEEQVDRTILTSS